MPPPAQNCPNNFFFPFRSPKITFYQSVTLPTEKFIFFLLHFNAKSEPKRPSSLLQPATGPVPIRRKGSSFMRCLHSLVSQINHQHSVFVLYTKATSIIYTLIPRSSVNQNMCLFARNRTEGNAIKMACLQEQTVIIQ